MIFISNLIKIEYNYDIIHLYVNFNKGFGKIFYKINIGKDIFFSLRFILYFLIKKNFFNKKYFFNLYNIYIEIKPFKIFYKKICINITFLFLLISNFFKINLNKFLIFFYYYNDKIYFINNFKKKIYKLYKIYYDKNYLIINFKYNFLKNLIKNFKFLKIFDLNKFLNFIEKFKGI